MDNDEAPESSQENKSFGKPLLISKISFLVVLLVAIVFCSKETSPPLLLLLGTLTNNDANIYAKMGESKQAFANRIISSLIAIGILYFVWGEYFFGKVPTISIANIVMTIAALILLLVPLVRLLGRQRHNP